VSSQDLAIWDDATKPIEIGHKSLGAKEFTSYGFGLLYAKRTQFWVVEDGTLQEDAGRVCKGLGARGMDVLRSLIFDLCSFSGKASLAVANRHDRCHPGKLVELLLTSIGE
jgi:hypothetical protein